MGQDTAPQRADDEHASGATSTDQEDVLLDIPVLNVDSIDLEVRDLRARLSLQAEVLNLLRLNVGVDAVLGEVKLGIRGVEAQALLKVRLDNVAAILNRVLDTINSNPQIIEPLTRATAVAHDQAGIAVGQAVRDSAAGAGQAVRDAGQEVAQAGQGATQGLGQGAGRAAQQAGQAAQQAGRGQSGREVRQWSTQAGPEQTQQGQGQQGQEDQGGEPPSVEACATVAADTWQSGEGGQSGRAGEPSGQASGERRYRGLPRRTRRRW